MGETDRATLLEPFHPSTYEYDPKGNVYIGGPVIEQRLDRATGGLWSVHDMVVTDRASAATSDKAIADVVCALWLDLPGIGRRPGYGQMTLYANADYADAAKGAITGALRSAANRFGVARELWPLLAADHWMNWLSLITPEDADTAQQLLMATFQWLDSKDASQKHREAWNACHEDVQAALTGLFERVGGSRTQDTDGDEPDDEPAADEQPHSDNITMRRLSKRYSEVLEMTNAAAADRERRATNTAVKQAITAGKIVAGGTCEARLSEQAERAKAHCKALAEAAAQPQDVDPAEVAAGIIRQFEEATNPDQLAAAQIAAEAVKGALSADLRYDLDDADTRASERIAGSEVAA